MIPQLWVGESWGENELLLGHPFVGAAGQELARIATDAKVITTPLPYKDHNGFYSTAEMVDFWKTVAHRDGIHLTNVFHAHPENNNIELFFSLDGDRNLPPLKAGKYILPEYFPHVQNLWREVNFIKPNVIVALGNTPSWALLGRTGISRIRGALAWSENLKVKVIPTYHPSYIIRGQWSDRPIVLADLQKAKRQEGTPELSRPEVWILRDPTIAEIEEWFDAPAMEYAVDIETGYALYSRAELKRMTPSERYFLSSQISMISFARTESEVIVIEFLARHKPGMNYWPTVEEEAEVWKLIKRGLKRPIKKVYQNGLYDMSRCLENGLPTYALGMEDTMLRQHARYPEMMKGLGFLASIYVEDIEWKSVYANREQLKRDE